MIFAKFPMRNRLTLIFILLATGLSLMQCSDAPFSTVPEPQEAEPFHPIVGQWQFDRVCNLFGSDCTYPDNQTSLVMVFFENDSSYIKTVNGTVTESSRFKVVPVDGSGFEQHDLLLIEGEEFPSQIEYIRNDTLRLIEWDEQGLFEAVYYLRQH